MNSSTAGNDTERSRRGTLLHEDVTGRILGAFFHVYNTLGYGFLESVYAGALAREMMKRGLTVEREVAIEVRYDGAVVGVFRADLLVNRAVIVEIKATRALTPADAQQLLNYLRGTELEVGLLLHFGPRPTFRRLISSDERR
jgi:GxxExxY protein